MIPWEKLDTASIPGSSSELRLMRRGHEFSIMHGSIELMSSRLTGSEESLATLACERLAHIANPVMLIGGLGMGFTLRAALGSLSASARVVVAELAPAVIAWGRGPMADLFGGCLDDPRVSIHEGDVGALMGRERARYDAILLDVDNGPEGLVRESNDWLYSKDGLRVAGAALKPGGVLAVWSSTPDRTFKKRLSSGGFAVDEVRARASTSGRGARHVIWFATRAQR
ncbi:MAG: spermidine synthase [Beijerinckiaceae bacterium]|nr:spermidine synthase [Beijerinckiaceae bacterium]